MIFVAHDFVIRTFESQRAGEGEGRRGGRGQEPVGSDA